ncbi:ATP-dependent helicase HrpB, partial [Streptomyces sp. A7024]|nr:ATP-dependent helicase HrpB [Streptomyces coryli]
AAVHRAGREAPGTVYRCWPEAEHGRLPRYPSPEIAVADLTAFALQAACWGDPEARDLALLDAPPAGAMGAARGTLRAIGALDESGRATRRGEALSRLGVHPRLARALLDGAAEVGARAAAEAVALLSDEPPRDYGDDLAAALRRAQRGQDAYASRWRTEARRLERAVRDAEARPAEGGRQDSPSPVLTAEPGGATRVGRAGVRAPESAAPQGDRPWPTSSSAAERSHAGQRHATQEGAV